MTDFAPQQLQIKLSLHYHYGMHIQKSSWCETTG